MLFVANSQREAALRAVKRQNLSTLRLAVMSQSQLIASTRTLLATLADAPIVRNGEQANCNALLANALNASTGYRGFSVSDRTGKSWCRAPNPNTVADNSASEFFTRTLETKSFVMGGFQIGSVSKRGNLTFGFPVLDKQGELSLLTRLNGELEQRVDLCTEQLQRAMNKLTGSREALRHLSHQQRAMLEEEQMRISRDKRH